MGLTTRMKGTSLASHSTVRIHEAMENSELPYFFVSEQYANQTRELKSRIQTTFVVYAISGVRVVLSLALGVFLCRAPHEDLAKVDAVAFGRRD